MNKQVNEIFNRALNSQKKTRIKLLGDSITHGVGGTDFVSHGEIFMENCSRNDKGYCWANLFKEYMQSRYNCEVVNNGVSGITIEGVINSADILVDDSDDIIICTIGTNNRHQLFKDAPKRTAEDMRTAFCNNLIRLHDIFKDKNKQFVFVANLPASDGDEKDGPDYWRIMHMKDISEVHIKAQAECGFPLINLYELVSDYCRMEGVSIDSLLADGLHPNDAGYKLMFEFIISEIGI